MADPAAVEPVKVFVAILWQDEDALDQAKRNLSNEWGRIDYEGPDHPFDTTHFYDEEMGTGLHRRIVSHEDVVSPDFLPSAKHRCNHIEDELKGTKGRRVNLDVGYLDHNKIVLASMKAAGQKIYLTDGVYADLTARFGQGRYQPFEWTFPDLRDGRYDEEWARIREIYKRQRKARGIW
jgi:hypothetical protein